MIDDLNEIDSIYLSILNSINFTEKSLTSINKEDLKKEFISIMCDVITDIREIKERIKEYKKRYNDLQNQRGLEIEYQRRKLLYFCKINKKALDDICSFLSESISQYIDQHILTPDNCAKYQYEILKNFYSCDYPYEVVIKVDYYILYNYFKDNDYDVFEFETKEKCLMDLYDNNPDDLWKMLYDYIDNNSILAEVIERINGCYHLAKRKEIFEILSKLFYEENYLTFITLGLLQIEGLFDDYSKLKFGESKDQGTLIEKVDKTLNNNTFEMFKLYPYFAFDIPRLRNEVAHTGMISTTKDQKKISYDLIFDLYILSGLVENHSCTPIRNLVNIYDSFIEYTAYEGEDLKYICLIYQLFYGYLLTPADFKIYFSIIKKYQDFENELNFYGNAYSKIKCISEMILKEETWSAIVKIIKKDSAIPIYMSTLFYYNNGSFFQFAEIIKNDYISILSGKAKDICKEVSKLLKESK